MIGIIKFENEPAFWCIINCSAQLYFTSPTTNVARWNWLNGDFMPKKNSKSSLVVSQCIDIGLYSNLCESFSLVCWLCLSEWFDLSFVDSLLLELLESSSLVCWLCLSECFDLSFVDSLLLELLESLSLVSFLCLGDCLDFSPSDRLL